MSVNLELDAEAEEMIEDYRQLGSDQSYALHLADKILWLFDHQEEDNER